MSSLLCNYPDLLARASRAFGGASPEDFRDLLGRELDREAKRRFAPLFQSLATVSGHGAGPLFTGMAATATGIEALRRAHLEAFGSAIDPSALSVLGTIQDDSFTAQLADRLALNNDRLWRSQLAAEIRERLPALPHCVVEHFVRTASPSDWIPPAGACGALIDELDRAVLQAAKAVVENTKRSLNRPSLPGGSIESKAARCLSCPYLRRCYQRTVRQGVETMLLHAGYVHAGGEHCISRAALRAWLKRQRAQQRWMAKVVIRDRFGEVPDRALIDVAPSDHARRSRLLAVLAGIDTLAMETGLNCAMVTLTLPPEWHPNPSHGGKSWPGASHSPAAGARELLSRWAAYLRDLANATVRICGIKVVEAHRDGCPHVHCLVYYRPEHESVIIDRLAETFDVPSVRLRSCVLKTHGRKVTHKGIRYDVVDEHYVSTTGEVLVGGGECHRIEFARVNRALSSAASYVAKYVVKALNSQLPDEDSEAESNSGLIAAAHAYTWGYRRFSLFGVRGKLTAWDELRRVRKAPEDPVAGAVWQFARNGDFAGYLRIIGGLAPVSTSKPALELCLTHAPRKTKFGDVARSITGVRLQCSGVLLFAAVTRTPGRYELVPLEPAFCEVEIEFQLTD
jgi:hypothetical protein